MKDIDKADNMIEVIKAWKEGKTIEWVSKGLPFWTDCDLFVDPSIWDWKTFDFRVKKESSTEEDLQEAQIIGKRRVQLAYAYRTSALVLIAGITNDLPYTFLSNLFLAYKRDRENFYNFNKEHA
jgi:hypothetical protein